MRSMTPDLRSRCVRRRQLEGDRPTSSAPASAPERLALGRDLVAGRRFAEALAEGIGADHLWLRPPLWEGRIDLPEPDGDRLRLVIAEYEEYPTDGAAPRHSMTSTRTGRRLVYVDHVDLS